MDSDSSLRSVLALVCHQQHRQQPRRSTEARFYFTHSSFWRYLRCHCSVCLPDSRLVDLVLGSRATRYRDITGTRYHNLRHVHQNQMTTMLNHTVGRDAVLLVLWVMAVVAIYLSVAYPQSY